VRGALVYPLATVPISSIADERAESYLRFETNTFFLPLTTRWTFWPYGERDNSPCASWLLVVSHAFLCHVLPVANSLARPEHVQAHSPLESCLPVEFSLSRGGPVST
jgi:hypothetical protein